MVNLLCFDYNKSLVSLATHSQSRLNSFQTVKTLFLHCFTWTSRLHLFSRLCPIFSYIVSSVAKRTLSVREVWGSIPGPVKSTQSRQRLATVVTFLRSCVAQALSRGNGPRNSLHASAYYGEYNEDLIFVFCFIVTLMCFVLLFSHHDIFNAAITSLLCSLYFVHL